MAGEVEPEIIPPKRRGGRKLDDATLGAMASILDDLFRLPGTSIRFGLDPLLGLIPGLGDLVTSVASFLIVFAAWQLGLPRVTMARMVANIAIDTLVGAVPVVGDVFDVAWKSNRKNLALLQRATERRRPSASDWLFLAAIAVIALLVLIAPFAVIWLIVRHR